jgi:hypothetical protein
LDGSSGSRGLKVGTIIRMAGIEFRGALEISHSIRKVFFLKGHFA